MTLPYYNQLVQSNGHYRFFEGNNRAKSLPDLIIGTDPNPQQPTYHHHEWRIYNYDDYNIQTFKEELPARLRYTLVPNREPELARRIRDNQINFRNKIRNFRRFKSLINT